MTALKRFHRERSRSDVFALEIAKTHLSLLYKSSLHFTNILLTEDNDGCHVVTTVSCLKRVKIVSQVKKAIQSYRTRKLQTSEGNGGIGNVEVGYDAICGYRTGSNTSSPSVPVSPWPVSCEASRDFVALNMWLGPILSG